MSLVLPCQMAHCHHIVSIYRSMLKKTCGNNDCSSFLLGEMLSSALIMAGNQKDRNKLPEITESGAQRRGSCGTT